MENEDINIINSDNNNNLQQPLISSNTENKNNIILNELPQPHKILPPSNTIKSKSISIFKLQFALATSSDVCVIIVASFMSIFMAVQGIAFEILLGLSINTLSTCFHGDIINNQPCNIFSSILTYIILYVILALCSLFFGFGYFKLWYTSGKSISKRYRTEYFRALSNQDQEWFDLNNPFELSSKIENQIKEISAALGLKIGFVILTVASIILGFAICLIINWQLTLVVSCICPFIIFFIYKLSSMTDEYQELYENEYDKAGAIAEEALYKIKTVYAFNNQYKEYKNFENGMKNALKIVLKRASIVAIVYGVCELLCHLSEAFSMFFFAGFAKNNVNKFQIGDLIIIIDVLIFHCCMSLNETFPCIKLINQACFAASKFYSLREQRSKMDFSLSKTQKIASPENKIQFQNVSFTYPQNNDSTFTNLNINFLPNKINILVGSSGSGKTTILSLLMRLYDVNSGDIIINGLNIKEYDYTYLKSLFGYIPQEPILMNTTIRDNILMGKTGISDKAIIECARKTGALKVINSKTERLNYVVGVKGSKLSGGEKQLIAITRALITNPHYLIMDEATSALDNKSELQVNECLKEIIYSQHITVIQIAHRLSTIVNADVIHMLHQGEIIASGNHSELSETCEEYKLLVLEMKAHENEEKENQKEEANDDDDDDNDNDDDDESENENCLIERTESKIDNKINEDFEIEMKGNINLESELDEFEENLPSPRTKSFVSFSSAHRNKFQLHSSDKKGKRRNSMGNRSDIIDGFKKDPDYGDYFKNTLHNNFFKQLGKNPKPKKWLLKMVNDKCLLLSTICTSLLSGILWPISGYVISKYCDDLLISVESSTGTTNNSYFDFSNETIILGIKYLIIYAIIAVLIGSVCFWKSYSLDRMGEYISRKLRIVIFKKYLTMHCEFFDAKSNSPSILISKLAFDADNVNNIVFSSIGIIIEAVVTFVTVLLIGCRHNVIMSIIFLVLSPFILLSMGFYFYIDQFETIETEKTQVITGEALGEFINNIKTIKSYNFQEEYIQKYQQSIDSNEHSTIKKITCIGVSYGISLLINNLAYAGIFVAGSVLIDKGKLTFSDFVQVLMPFYLSLYYLSVAQVYIGDLAKANNSLNNLYQIHEMRTFIENKDIVEHETTTNQLNIKGDITFNNVSFAYSGNRKKKILNKFSYHIPNGKHIGIVGFSGSGKSTIIQLIERFFDVTKGQIKIDGRPISSYNINSLRNVIGYVQQEPLLFNSSIEDNIKYGNCLVSDEELMTMMKEMKIDHLLNKNYELNEEDEEKEGNTRGEKVSGGEKQRIALLRAIVKKPKILLLDEATSSLDRNLEKEIQMVLKKYTNDCTVVTIAHRLSTVVNCDEIIVLEKGNIIEIGTHEMLMEKQGRYYELYQLNKNEEVHV